MHEYSLVRGLLSQIEDLRKEHAAGSVISVRLMIGEFSGVEADLLQSAFLELSQGTAVAGASVDIHRTTLEARCEECGREFMVQKFRFVCPGCQSGRTTICRGDELLLESVTFGK